MYPYLTLAHPDGSYEPVSADRPVPVQIVASSNPNAPPTPQISFPMAAIAFKGDKGDEGDRGDKGDKGEPGLAGGGINGLTLVDGALKSATHPAMETNGVATFTDHGQRFGTKGFTGEIHVPKSLFTQDNFTFETYICHDGNFVNTAVILGENPGLSTLYLTVSGNIGLSTEGKYFEGTANLADNVPRHIRAVFSTKGCSVSVDGALVASTTLSSHWDVTPTTVGNIRFGTNQSFSQALSETAFFNGSLSPNYSVPTAPYTGNEPNLAVLCHFDGDCLNYAAAAATFKTVAPSPVDGSTITRNATTGALSAPNVAPFKLYFRPSTDGGNGSSLNAAMLDAQNQGNDVLYIFPGSIYADVPVAPPDKFHLIGLGQINKDSWNSPGRGVQINTGLNSRTGCIDIVGTKPDPSRADGFVTAYVENIACAGEVQDSQATRAGGPPRLVRVINAYAPQLHNISVSGDFVGGFYFENVWDWYLSYLFGNVVGFSDMRVTADSAAVRSYTGRAFTALETRLARSFGVPMMEVVSPNTNGGGQDTVNNKRTENLHFEGNAENAVAILIRGGNANMLKFVGLKCELTQGNVPIIVADDVAGLRIEGLIHGAGNGYPFGNFGGTTTADQYSSLEVLPLVLLGAGCLMPQLDLTMSFQGGGPGSLRSFVTCFGTEYPIIRVGIIDGISMLKSAGSGRIILDNCGPVSLARVNAYAQRYVQDGKNNEIVLVGNTTLVP